jgi:hypothetical protein
VLRQVLAVKKGIIQMQVISPTSTRHAAPPVGVAFLAMLYGAAGVALIASIPLVLLVESAGQLLGFNAFGFPAVLVVVALEVVVALLCFLVGFGLLEYRQKARMAALIVAATLLLSQLSLLVVGHNPQVPLIVFAVAQSAYLLLPRVTAAFRR